MATLSWNEIKDRALRFSNDWKGETREHAEAKTFWDEFFHVFGVSRRRVASFEEPVKKLNTQTGFIDLFWRGTLLVEHKSKGKDLDKAYSQALDYFCGLKEHELPKYVLVSDFERFRLYNLEAGTQEEFHIRDLRQKVKLFGFIAGYQEHVIRAEDPVNVKAAAVMGRLHDALKDSGYEGHVLEVYLVRLLFALFADDTGIFEKSTFRQYLEERTHADGSNLGPVLAELFQTLDTPPGKRLANTEELLSQFPYVNGRLFEEPLRIAAFNSKMRDILMECCALDWGRISPAIFGSMFQAVMSPDERRNLGAHYTSEQNILKLINPLFLDDLRVQFSKCRGSRKKLVEFHEKLSKLKILDPACGCGNFLIITYRELRLLELDVLRELHKDGQAVLDVSDIMWIDVDQFYGIECEEWPARIAEVAMWLMDHQMNMLVSEEFGQYFVRLPLKKSAHITYGNALRINWDHLISGSYIDLSADTLNVMKVEEPGAHYGSINVAAKQVNILSKEEIRTLQTRQREKFDFILGNPPFVGGKYQSKAQREEMAELFAGVKGAGVLDYVTAWYIKAARYMQGTQTKTAFVSTNSITQGEQVGILWSELSKYGIKIHFAHRTFRWSNEASGKAAVHCVIVGFAPRDTDNKRLFDYEDISGEAHEKSAENISPYLVEGTNLFVINRTRPLCDAPIMSFGNQPIDGGHLLLNADEKQKLLDVCPQAKEYLRPFLGSQEFINGIERWCLWFNDAKAQDLRGLKPLQERIEAVQDFRLSSNRQVTRELASLPYRFAFISHKETSYLLVPSVSSERRTYIPMGFLPADTIASNLCLIIPDAQIYHFGVLTSAMHMAWVHQVCGRLKSDYRYSAKLVYNNFPWPENLTAKQRGEVEKKAQAVLNVRQKHFDGGATLADLYDPLYTPADLLKAHQELDRAVDLCYRPQPFVTETARVEFLFNLYAQYTESLLNQEKTQRKPRVRA